MSGPIELTTASSGTITGIRNALVAASVPDLASVSATATLARSLSTSSPRIVLLGDSIFSDIFGTESLWRQIKDIFPGRNADVIPLGISSQTSAQVLARAAADLALYAPNTTGIPAALITNVGINDVTFGGFTAAQTWANIKAILVIARNLGYDVGCCTYFGFPFENPMEILRLAIHALMLAEPTAYDFICRWDLVNGKYRADYFRSGDLVHPNVKLNKLLAASLVAGMEGRAPVLLEQFTGSVNAAGTGTTGTIAANTPTKIAMFAVTDSGSRWSGTQWATPSKSLYAIAGTVGYDGTFVAGDSVILGLYVNDVIAKTSGSHVGVAYTALPNQIHFHWMLEINSFRAVDIRLISTKAVTVRDSPPETNITIRQLPPADTLL